MEIKTVLKNIGFEPNEIEIYLYLQKHGASSQQRISDETRILRQTVYDIMGKMVSKGFVSVAIVGKRKHYKAIEPKILLKQLQEKEDQLSEAIPSLESLRLPTDVDISSESFIGLEGLKNLVNLTLESKSEILWISNKKIHDKIFQEYYWHNYAEKRAKKKIPIKLLIEPNADNGWKPDKKILRETRRDGYVENLETSYVVFEGGVIIYSLQDENLFGVFIKNDTIKKSFEKMFYRIWDQSKKD
jgi:HTH-type transcriptional regulator, sugar sensing transcriptional regulator